MTSKSSKNHLKMYYSSRTPSSQTLRTDNPLSWDIGEGRNTCVCTSVLNLVSVGGEAARGKCESETPSGGKRCQLQEVFTEIVTFCFFFHALRPPLALPPSRTRFPRLPHPLHAPYPSPLATHPIPFQPECGGEATLRVAVGGEGFPPFPPRRGEIYNTV